MFRIGIAWAVEHGTALEIRDLEAAEVIGNVITGADGLANMLRNKYHPEDGHIGLALVPVSAVGTSGPNVLTGRMNTPMSMAWAMFLLPTAEAVRHVQEQVDRFLRETRLDDPSQPSS